MNNQMKYVFLGLFMISITGGAQTHSKTNHSKETKIEQLKRVLDLTDAQVLKIKAIEDSFEPEKKDLRIKMSDVKRREREEFDKVFTPEQRLKLKELHEKYKNK